MSRSLASITPVICTLVIAGAYLVNGLESSTAAANAVALRSRAYPLLLAGEQIDVEENTIVIAAFTPPTGGPITRTVVLVVDDRCSICQRALPDFIGLLCKLHSYPETNVDIVSLHGEVLATRVFAACKGAAIKTTVLTPVTPAAYTTATGLVASPLLLALDSQRRVKFVLPGFNRAGLDCFGRLLSMEDLAAASQSVVIGL